MVMEHAQCLLLASLQWWFNVLSFQVKMSRTIPAAHLHLQGCTNTNTHTHTAPSFFPHLCLEQRGWCFGRGCVRQLLVLLNTPPPPPPPNIKTPAGCFQFIQQPLPLMEYFTHLSKQINWVQTDVKGANHTAPGQRILLPVASL